MQPWISSSSSMIKWKRKKKTMTQVAQDGTSALGSDKPIIIEGTGTEDRKAWPSIQFVAPMSVWDELCCLFILTRAAVCVIFSSESTIVCHILTRKHHGHKTKQPVKPIENGSFAGLWVAATQSNQRLQSKSLSILPVQYFPHMAALLLMSVLTDDILVHSLHITLCHVKYHLAWHQAIGSSDRLVTTGHGSAAHWWAFYP